jgi:hypothetical protein
MEEEDVKYTESQMDRIDNPKLWLTGFVGSMSAEKSSDNLAMSILSGCISGIWKNLQQWRQIDCEYIRCLRQDVPLDKPVAACKMKQDYDWCVVTGSNFFSLIPLVHYFEQVISLIQKYFGSPAAIAFWLFSLSDYICDAFCAPGGPAGGCSLCHLKRWAGVIGQIIADVQGIIRPEAWTGGSDICPEALEGIDEIRERVAKVEGMSEEDSVEF